MPDPMIAAVRLATEAEPTSPCPSWVLGTIGISDCARATVATFARNERAPRRFGKVGHERVRFGE
jgi:hypothetical protein